MFKINISTNKNKNTCTDYTDINGWRVNIRLPEELSCDLLEHITCILNEQEDAFYKLELYLAYNTNDKNNYALLCTQKITNPVSQKLCIVIVNNEDIIDLISVEAKRIIRCKNECPYDYCNCHKQSTMEYGIPKYYYLTNRNFFAVYSCEESIPLKISRNALRVLYSIIKSYFSPICCTNESNSKMGLRAYPTAANDQITDFEVSTTTS